jgi:hypothetical protein
MISAMAHDQRFGTHPMCTCPPTTFSGGPDRKPCRDRAAPIDPHPVLTADDLRAMSLAIATPGHRAP